MSENPRILFVCLGNICRSPMAEYVVRQVAERRGLNGRFLFASAGTGSWHVGHGADERARETALRHGLDMSAHRARQITRHGIEDWDWFVAMDHANRLDLLDMGAPPERVLMMRQFEVDDIDAAPDVPDPYYGGPDGFEDAYRMLTANAERLLDFLEARLG